MEPGAGVVRSMRATTNSYISTCIMCCRELEQGTCGARENPSERRDIPKRLRRDVSRKEVLP
tara:strand:+ start:154 stop:339 length:186 start_codon:yes stop_codon:yes gene_type:complete